MACEENPLLLEMGKKQSSISNPETGEFRSHGACEMLSLGGDWGWGGSCEMLPWWEVEEEGPVRCCPWMGRCSSCEMLPW